MIRLRNSKYGAKKTVVDGIKFDSKTEAEYFSQNKPLIKELQPKIYLTKARILYKPDFLLKSGEYVDVKGFETPVFKLKKKLWKFYGAGKLLIIKKKGRSFFHLRLPTSYFSLNFYKLQLKGLESFQRKSSTFCLNDYRELNLLY